MSVVAGVCVVIDGSTHLRDSRCPLKRTWFFPQNVFFVGSAETVRDFESTVISGKVATLASLGQESEIKWVLWVQESRKP